MLAFIDTDLVGIEDVLAFIGTDLVGIEDVVAFIVTDLMERNLEKNDITTEMKTTTATLIG